MTEKLAEPTATTEGQPQVTSAFFAQPEQVERAVADLVASGVPRDLIDVIVSPQANQAHYGGRARRLGSQTMRFAGAGALLGLLIGVVLSLEIILVFPAAEPPAGELSVTQLLGPNVAMMIGLVLGALFGAFVRRKPWGSLARVRDRDEILIAVRATPAERVPDVVATLEAAGGHETLTTSERRRRLRWW
jgi:hypothetical protein